MRYQVTFHGMVQGVGFRATAKDLARDFPVTGFVRNEPDGSVFLVVEGDEEQLEKYLDALRAALHEKIRSEELEAFEAERGYPGFEIR
ncbi:MAG: acylphosphatase [Phycisphaeraceae bacterium]|nr:acylphosphatase [Phycisphaeraceae bacterium]